MRHHLHLDFETYSEVSIKQVGTSRYAEHPSTEALCLAWAVDEEEPEIWVAGDDPPEELFRLLEGGARAWAWNVEMEIPTWESVCVARMGWPRVPRRQWRDAAALALTFALPAKLEMAAKAVRARELKDPAGDKLVRKLCKPRKPTKNNPATRWTREMVPEDYAGLYRYCKQDVRAERSVLKELPRRDMTRMELANWRLTTEMNLRGWAVDVDSARRMIAMLAQHKAARHLDLERITGGAVTTGGQVDRMRAWLRAEHGVKLADMTADTVKAALRRDLPGPAKQVLGIRQELALSSVKKYTAMVQRACDDGTVKNNIMHHGASTGRDAGRGMQIQNFVRKSVSKTQQGIQVALRALVADEPAQALERVMAVYGSPSHFASYMTRSMLMARDGHYLLAGDYKQIENRVTVWYAGCRFGIQVYRDGKDEYIVYAGRFYKVPESQVTDEQRQHCKHQVLGFCFGMAEETYVKQALKFGQVVAIEDARAAKNAYRKTYHEVVQLWYGLNDAALSAVKHKGREFGYENGFGELTFECRDGFLFMRLASGRRLAYFHPRVELLMPPWGKKRADLKETVTHMGMGPNNKWIRRKATPGRWTENAVQATARDVMMHGCRQLAVAEYKQVGRVHDEIISESPHGEGSLAEYLALMDNPPWLRGIPIEADGWEGQRYRKE